MIRWVAVIFIALIVFPILLPGMQRVVGRVPGDVRFRLFGRIFSLPFGSTVLASTLAFLIAQVLHGS